MLKNYLHEIILQGKYIRSFLMFGIYKDINQKSFLKNSFLKNNYLKNKIKNNV